MKWVLVLCLILEYFHYFHLGFKNVKAKKKTTVIKKTNRGQIFANWRLTIKNWRFCQKRMQTIPFFICFELTFWKVNVLYQNHKSTIYLGPKEDYTLVQQLEGAYNQELKSPHSKLEAFVICHTINAPIIIVATILGLKFVTQ